MMTAFRKPYSTPTLFYTLNVIVKSLKIGEKDIKFYNQILCGSFSSNSALLIFENIAVDDFVRCGI